MDFEPKIENNHISHIGKMVAFNEPQEPSTDGL